MSNILRQNASPTPRLSPVVCVTDSPEIAHAVTHALHAHQLAVTMLRTEQLLFASSGLASARIVVGADVWPLPLAQVQAIVAAEDLDYPTSPAEMSYGKQVRTRGQGQQLPKPNIGGRRGFTSDSSDVPTFILPEQADEFAAMFAARANPAVTNSGPDKHSRTIAMCNAVGGAGATTLAWVLALLVAQQGCVLIDGDSRSGGLDLWLGLEGEPASRWDAVARLTEPIDSTRALSALLPVTANLRLLTHGRSRINPSVESLNAFMSSLPPAAMRLIDLSADTSSDIARATLGASDIVVIVTRNTLTGCVNAHKLMTEIRRETNAPVVLAIREVAQGISFQALHRMVVSDAILGLPADTTVSTKLQQSRFSMVVSRRWRRALTPLLELLGDTNKSTPTPQRSTSLSEWLTR